MEATNQHAKHTIVLHSTTPSTTNTTQAIHVVGDTGMLETCNYTLSLRSMDVTLTSFALPRSLGDPPRPRQIAQTILDLPVPTERACPWDLTHMQMAPCPYVYANGTTLYQSTSLYNVGQWVYTYWNTGQVILHTIWSNNDIEMRTGVHLHIVKGPVNHVSVCTTCTQYIIVVGAWTFE